MLFMSSRNNSPRLMWCANRAWPKMMATVQREKAILIYFGLSGLDLVRTAPRQYWEAFPNNNASLFSPIVVLTPGFLVFEP